MDISDIKPTENGDEDLTLPTSHPSSYIEPQQDGDHVTPASQICFRKAPSTFTLTHLIWPSLLRGVAGGVSQSYVMLLHVMSLSYIIQSFSTCILMHLQQYFLQVIQYSEVCPIPDG
jgi:hypothetical protein